MNDTDEPNFKQPLQRGATIVVLIAVAYAIMSISAPGSDGTFSATSKPATKSAFSDEGDDAENSGWGNGTRGASSRSSRAEERARIERDRRGSDRQDIPTYDPGKDGGWGSQ